MSKRVKMTVEMDVTIPQGLALQAMFKHWNRLASWGSSRMVAFYVDGDGNFKPKCSVSFSEEMPELTEDLEKAACICEDQNSRYDFDFDPVAWKLREGEAVVRKLDVTWSPGETITIGQKDFDQMEKAIEQPPQANEALKSAMSKFKAGQASLEEQSNLKEAIDWAQANPPQESNVDETFEKLFNESEKGTSNGKQS